MATDDPKAVARVVQLPPTTDNRGGARTVRAVTQRSNAHTQKWIAKTASAGYARKQGTTLLSARPRNLEQR